MKISLDYFDMKKGGALVVHNHATGEKVFIKIPVHRSLLSLKSTIEQEKTDVSK